MPTYPFMQVDAFTDHPLGGNACAILFDCADLPDGTMLAVAREMNLSETSFVWRKPDGDFKARYFTPAEEIPLAGHPTIATVFALVESGRLELSADHLTIPLELRDGPINVEIFSADGRVERIVMAQRKPQFLRAYDPAEVLPVFGLEMRDLLPGAPIQTVSTGTPQLMIPLFDQDALRRIEPNIPAFKVLRGSSDFFSVHLFCVQPDGETTTFARHFVAPPDLLEDPFTGSATGGMGAYLWHYGLILEPRFIARQGDWMGRSGIGSVEVLGSRQDIETVKVGGQAVAVMKGEITV
jgi:trans-2,3-dihydro-3-hydroxyanthranilate isomerase